MTRKQEPDAPPPAFNRRFFESSEDFTVIGSPSIGGKAQGLRFIQTVLAGEIPDGRFENIQVNIPRLAVLGTDIFAAFLHENDLRGIAQSEDSDRRIANAFQKASLPATVLGDLRAIVDTVQQPLAVRSSSLLEDAMYRPFAGVYETKMIPNNQPDADTRFRRLLEAIKFVYASTFFKDAKSYIRSTDRSPEEERMAVIIQEVVGRRHEDRFYPDVSGVARSFNFYPVGHAAPADGVVSLALGLGKTIVEGGVCWSYAPTYPRTDPPFGSPRDLLNQTQTGFWAVNMGNPPEYDPVSEIEYLVQCGIDQAEEDGTLRHLVSTYDPQADRLVMGTPFPGPRGLTFAPLLRLDRFPLNDLVQWLMPICERAVGAPVEIEFAMTIPDEPADPARFGFLQVRPLVVSQETVEVPEEDLDDPRAFVASSIVLGNGIVRDLTDILYCIPERFDPARTRAIADEVERYNKQLAEEGRYCVLIGFGRWGTTDPWLGIPVKWGQISRARVIVETTLPDVNPDPSQGSHFFHNVTSFRVLYFSVRHTDARGIDWSWLSRQPAVAESTFIRHVRVASPMTVRVDGRTGLGVIERSG